MVLIQGLYQFSPSCRFLSHRCKWSGNESVEALKLQTHLHIEDLLGLLDPSLSVPCCCHCGFLLDYFKILPFHTAKYLDHRECVSRTNVGLRHKLLIIGVCVEFEKEEKASLYFGVALHPKRSSIYMMSPITK